jgi:hypothetical protein
MEIHLHMAYCILCLVDFPMLLISSLYQKWLFGNAGKITIKFLFSLDHIAVSVYRYPSLDSGVFFKS